MLSVPELTERYPWLGGTTITQVQKEQAISDEAFERLPQQILSLLRGSEAPRFVVYAYGQALRPAKSSIITSGRFLNMCTNYEVTAETATRSVVRIEGAPDNPHVVIESFNVL